ncbi:coiled-coil domain-containing protein 178 isoform X1 [Xenopus laevis]|uniref:Coiled-coil domain-containing protein 178 isoform X1 n=2 Tax=Xenopus laevis TaxID=8355 RepID=A0A8J0VHJ7_XENLA|nr:coiled-coil domain-containing protein 178 isoform X1 [Xenopus laevis]
MQASFEAKAEEKMMVNKTVPCAAMSDLKLSTDQSLSALITSRRENEVLIRPMKRHSCELVNTPLPCVTKALSHIEQLEQKMKECFLQQEYRGQRSDSKCVSYVPSGDNIRSASPEAPNLQVRGFGLTDKDCQQDGNVVLRRDTESVISEVAELIWRLEADRQEAEALLKLENKRQAALTEKIDGLSLWKSSHLPEAVQREYEACAQDISELQWHISCKQQDLENSQSKAAKTEAVNARLQEEIDFIKKHSPLLEDKLKLETETMNKIRQSQEEATVLLSEAEGKHTCALMSFDQATSEANKERTKMRAELEILERDLQSCKDTLMCFKNTWDEYNLKISFTEEKIAKSKNLLTDLMNEKQILKGAETSSNQQVRDLKYELEEQEMKNKDLGTECSKLSQEAELTKSDINYQLSHLENHLHSKLHALRDLQYQNRTLMLENEDLSAKIKNSSKARANHEADILRMQKNLLADEEQTLQVTRDLSQLSLSHAAMQTKLADAEDRAYKEETRLKNLLDVLRKQIMDQTRTSQQIQAQITAIMAEMQQRKKESETIRKELGKTAKEVEELTTDLESKIHKLRNLHNIKSEKKKHLLQKKQDSKEKYNVTSQQLGHKRDTLKQQLSDTQDQLSQVSEQIKNTMENTDKLLLLAEDLIKYGIIIENAKRLTTESVTKLRENYNILEFKLKNANDLSEHITDEVERCTKRLQMEKKDNETQIHTRQENEKQIKALLEASIQENVKLAKEYQTLQMHSLNEKDKLMVAYDKRLKMEASLRDYLQISVLQSRMHRALVEFFKQRGLYNQAGLASFQAASQENALKILAVQEAMSQTIQHVAAFLTSLAGGLPSEEAKENNQPVSDAETKDT